MEKDMDAREAKTISYREYQQLHEGGKENVTVRMENGDIHRNIDPVDIVCSEPRRSYDPRHINPFPFHKPPQDNDPNEKTEQPNAALFERSTSTHLFNQPVGWLICVDGPDYGKSFPLKEGKNYIGRSDTMDVVIKNDRAVSRNTHAWIEYLENKRKFYVSIGESHKIVYLNEDIVLAPKVMDKNDIISIGNSCLMLIPCCDRQFSWQTFQKQ